MGADPAVAEAWMSTTPKTTYTRAHDRGLVNEQATLADACSDAIDPNVARFHEALQVIRTMVQRKEVSLLRFNAADLKQNFVVVYL